MTTLNFGGTIPRAAGAPPAYKIEANPYPVDLPCETAAVPDKTFPGHRPSLEFPHPLQATPAEWVKALRKQRGKELGTSEKCTVRAFITPRSHGAIIYQIPSLANTTSKGFPIFTDPKKQEESIRNAAKTLRESEFE